MSARVATPARRPLATLLTAGVLAAAATALAPVAHAEDEPVRSVWYCTYTTDWKFIDVREQGVALSDYQAMQVPGSWYHDGQTVFVSGSKTTKPTFDQCTAIVKKTMVDDLPPGAWDNWDPRVGVQKKAPAATPTPTRKPTPVPSGKPTPTPAKPAPRGVPAKTGVEDDPAPLAPLAPFAAAGVLGLAALARRRD